MSNHVDHKLRANTWRIILVAYIAAIWIIIEVVSANGAVQATRQNQGAERHTLQRKTSSFVITAE